MSSARITSGKTTTPGEWRRYERGGKARPYTTTGPAAYHRLVRQPGCSMRSWQPPCLCVTVGLSVCLPACLPACLSAEEGQDGRARRRRIAQQRFSTMRRVLRPHQTSGKLVDCLFDWFSQASFLSGHSFSDGGSAARSAHKSAGSRI